MAKAPAPPLLFQIEIPRESRERFWARPDDGKLEFWAFSERPRCFVNERVVFTFDRRPVAEARVYKIEEPGASKCDASGKYERYHKVFWDPRGFVRYQQGKTASQWVGPVFHGTSRDFKEFDPQLGSITPRAGMVFFAENPEYADWFTSRGGGSYPKGANIWPAYIRLNKPFDATPYEHRPLYGDEFAEAVGTTEGRMRENSGPYSPSTAQFDSLPFWRWVVLFPEETRRALEAQGYDGIVQEESTSVDGGLVSKAYVVFNKGQIRSAFEKRGAARGPCGTSAAAPTGAPSASAGSCRRSRSTGSSSASRACSSSRPPSRPRTTAGTSPSMSTSPWTYGRPRCRRATGWSRTSTPRWMSSTPGSGARRCRPPALSLRARSWSRRPGASRRRGARDQAHQLEKMNRETSSFLPNEEAAKRRKRPSSARPPPTG